MIEYIGEVLEEEEYMRRKGHYIASGQRHYYFMNIGNGEVIDACRMGNQARFINHSCEPNCETQKWNVRGELAIGLFTLRRIRAGRGRCYKMCPASTQLTGAPCLPCASSCATLRDACVCAGVCGALHTRCMVQQRPNKIMRGFGFNPRPGLTPTQAQQDHERAHVLCAVIAPQARSSHLTTTLNATATSQCAAFAAVIAAASLLAAHRRAPLILLAWVMLKM